MVIVAARDADNRADAWAEVLAQINGNKTCHRGETVGMTKEKLRSEGRGELLRAIEAVAV